MTLIDNLDLGSQYVASFSKKNADERPLKMSRENTRRWKNEVITELLKSKEEEKEEEKFERTNVKKIK